MNPRQFHDLCIIPGLGFLPANMTSPEARLLLVAIGMQESALLTRHQSNGPAVGLYQFEQAGVDGVLGHPLTRDLAKDVAATLAIRSDYLEAARWNDHWATVLARLTLWPDPLPLPTCTDEDGAFSYYCRMWRPGKPSAARWKTSHSSAVACLGAIRT